MEKYELKNEVVLICQQSKSFPDGIGEAFDTLQKTVPEWEKRTWYGISRRNEEGEIIYKAAVNELTEEEAAKYNLEAFTLPKATYRTETLLNWKDNMELFGKIFMQLLDDPDLDYNYPCIEWYKSDDEVMCMVKLVR